MELVKSFGLLLLLLVCQEITGNINRKSTENKDRIEFLAKLLRETVKPDLELIAQKFDAVVNEINIAIGGLRKYTTDSIEELKTHLEKDVSENDRLLQENINNMEENNKDMLETSTTTIQKNIEDMQGNSVAERHEFVSWAHQRFHLHEDVLKTTITICAHDHGHWGKGVVTYNGAPGYVGNSAASSVSIRVFNNTEDSPGSPRALRRANLLNLRTGAFTVPPKAAGEYLFTFTVIMDTFDNRLMPAQYFFRVDGKRVKGTPIYTNAGSYDRGRKRSADEIPGSRTILLKLREGQQVDVEQTKNTDIADYGVSFCAALLHLEHVSNMQQSLPINSCVIHFTSGLTEPWRRLC